MQKPARLLDDGGDDIGMGMPGRVDRDAGRAVEKHIAIDVFDRRADARNAQKIQAALKTVAKTKKTGSEQTFFDLIGQGKLPGGDGNQ